jgi:hypothetical protein
MNKIDLPEMAATVRVLAPDVMNRMNSYAA